MPKMKTNRSAAKRFKVTARGKLRRKHAFHSHLLVHKNPKRKRRLAGADFVDESEARRMRRLIPYL